MNAIGAISSLNFHLNQKVSTPLGEGLYQAPFVVLDKDGQVVTKGLMVRLPVNEVTGKALRLSNCLTPDAKLNGLWIFQEQEVEGVK